MSKKTFLPIVLFSLGAAASFGQDVTIKLPPPQKTGGMPLMEALNARKSTRKFVKDRPVSDQVLSDLLWATWGFNREDKRTAPTAVNAQELDVYVLRDDGVWLYDARLNSLLRVHHEDVRAATVIAAVPQPFATDAPITLVYVSDTTKLPPKIGRPEWSLMNTGFLAQNAYLYCASVGLGTVVRGSFPPADLAKAMRLKETQTITLCQCIGWPE
ncbi:MAG TPA: SagB/ThcOx family dehydrogenase [Lentisphaeria bacterium]|nr:SagB/ThcOx family dehydrogenase [Lentisphaeria bacterium]